MMTRRAWLLADDPAGVGTAMITTRGRARATPSSATSPSHSHPSTTLPTPWAAANAEDRLWDAEIDWAIACRFAILRNPPADNQLKPRSETPTIDRSTKEHLRRYKQWKKNWPDVLTS
jgi:hypothetical protein